MLLRTLAVTALVLGAAATVAVASGAWPPVPDLDRQHVARSLTGAIDSVEEGSCHDVAPGRWRCLVADPGGSTAATYAVRATSEHCWAARRVGRADRAPRRASGCVH